MGEVDGLDEVLDGGAVAEPGGEALVHALVVEVEGTFNELLEHHSVFTARLNPGEDAALEDFAVVVVGTPHAEVDDGHALHKGHALVRRDVHGERVGVDVLHGHDVPLVLVLGSVGTVHDDVVEAGEPAGAELGEQDGLHDLIVRRKHYHLPATCVLRESCQPFDLSLSLFLSLFTTTGNS